jgi:hypothetical protein
MITAIVCTAFVASLLTIMLMAALAAGADR